MSKDTNRHNDSLSPLLEGEEGGRKITFKTLGCRLNQYETDALVSDFHKAGYDIVDFNDAADVVVVNTCTVTNQSDQKSRQTISQAARKHKGSVVVVTGCMANNHKEKLEDEEKITYVVDNTRKSSILSLIDSHFSGEILHPSKLPQDVFSFDPVQKSLHTRSAIKVQDGCDNFCTYCIIPKVRGRAVSRPVEEVLENIRQTIQNGFKEIMITGVNIGRYEYEGYNFEGLLRKILEVEGDFRVRISSLEPDGLTDQFVELFEHPKLMPHLHLCLQSGSDKVLLRMRRMYNLDQFRSTVQLFRAKFPDFNFTTDIIVGFPDESEEDFQLSLDAVKAFNFSHIHTFKYSVRRGTRAERMENHIPEKVKNERSAVVRELSEKNKTDYFRSFIGKTETVLVEKVSQGVASGYGDHYIPISFKGKDIQKNTFHRIRIKELKGSGEKSYLFGELTT